MGEGHRVNLDFLVSDDGIFSPSDSSHWRSRQYRRCARNETVLAQPKPEP